MRTKNILSALGIIALVGFQSCKNGCTDPAANNFDEKAIKDDGNCLYGPDFTVPTTYTFVDANGNNTVSYSGQTDRLNQLGELSTYAKSGNSAALSEQVMIDMFENTGDNGNGNFSFSSSKQLKNKCVASEVSTMEGYLTQQATASNDYLTTASNGQAGTLSSGTSTYLFASNGVEYAQLIEKGIMGAVFMYQANNVYFGSSKMDVDNTTPVDAAAGKHYTAMAHHFDEAFGYFGVPTDFPSNTSGIRYWGKYCNSQNDNLGSNAIMAYNFRLGRAAIVNQDLDYRDEAIVNIQKEWEKIAASQAITYFNSAKTDITNNDAAKRLHHLSEAYAFVYALKYVPIEIRKMTVSEIDALLNSTFASNGTLNMWNVQISNIDNAISSLSSTFGF